eukprot:3046439-Rhodomonas_salina.2
MAVFLPYLIATHSLSANAHVIPKQVLTPQYGATRNTTSWSTRVLPTPQVLRRCYAVCGTERGYAGTRVCASAMPPSQR